MAMRHLIASKRRSSSSASRNRLNHSLEEPSSNFSSNVEATNTSNQIGSSPSVTSESTTNISTTQLNQNPVAMRQRATSKRGSSSSSRTSNLSSRSNHYLDTEATKSYRQTGSSPSVTSEAIEKIFGHSLEDLVKAGKVVKPKTAQEFEIAKARDINNMIEMYYHCLFYPAKINNPEITNAWAIAHPDAPEIKELGIDAEMLRFISQLEKIKHVKGMPANLIFENPILFDKKQQRDYMKRLVTSLE